MALKPEPRVFPSVNPSMVDGIVLISFKVLLFIKDDSDGRPFIAFQLSQMNFKGK